MRAGRLLDRAGFSADSIVVRGSLLLDSGHSLDICPGSPSRRSQRSWEMDCSGAVLSSEC